MLFLLFVGFEASAIQLIFVASPLLCVYTASLLWLAAASGQTVALYLVSLCGVAAYLWQYTGVQYAVPIFEVLADMTILISLFCMLHKCIISCTPFVYTKQDPGVTQQYATPETASYLMYRLCGAFNMCVVV